MGSVDAKTSFIFDRSKLEGASDVLYALICGKDLAAHQMVTLDFPDDTAEAWEHLLHYIKYGQLSAQAADNTAILVDSWVLGEELEMAYFQNAAMTKLLKRAEQDIVDTDVGEIQHAFASTSEGSPIRMLFAEELLRDFEREGSGYQFSDYEDVSGLLEEMVKAQRRFSEQGDYFEDRLFQKDGCKRSNDFMV